jgi:peroxiredoxin
MDANNLSTDLPVPQDDGAADHLVGSRLPAVLLPSTAGEAVELDALGDGRTVICLYPGSGPPDIDLLDAGASRVFAVSSQDTADQSELVDRLRPPFPMLSDPGMLLGRALDLPTFEVDGRTLYRRLTLVVLDGVIEHVFYPVFPPEHAQQVRSWLHSRHGRDPDRRDRWLTTTWKWVRQTLPPAPAGVLEIGCGTEGGFVPAMIDSGYDALGVDPMAPAGAPYRQLPFERLALDEPVDAVVVCTALHHVEDLDQVLTLITSALRPGGILTVVEWDWQRLDERSARWCFDRLGEGGSGHGWLTHLREAWLESGQSWGDYLRGWASEAGLHTGDAMLRALDTHLDRQSLGRGPAFFADLADTSRADEQAAVDAGLIEANGISYVGRRR